MTEPDVPALPDDRLYAPMQDMWVRLEEGGLARVGATHPVAMHGQFMVFTPRAPGTEVDYDRSMGVMETAKTAVAVHAPLSCTIVEVNPKVVGDPAPIERDPYGEGWMYVVRPKDLAAERVHLLDAAAYAHWLAPRLAEKIAQSPFDETFAENLDVDPHRGY